MNTEQFCTGGGKALIAAQCTCSELMDRSDDFKEENPEEEESQTPLETNYASGSTDRISSI